MDEPLKAYLLDLDRAIVARGGQSIYGPRSHGAPAIAALVAFERWENEKLEWHPPKADPPGQVWCIPDEPGRMAYLKRV